MLKRILLGVLLLANLGWTVDPPGLPAAEAFEASLSAPTWFEDSFTPQQLEPNRWIWASDKAAGPWGLEAMRVPQLWNLNDVIQRQGQRVFTGVLDAGFQDDNADGWDDHADLLRIQTLVFDGMTGELTGGAVKSAHGQHVAGIIGAEFNNRLGIDGVNPFAEIIAVSPQIPRQKQRMQESWQVMIEALLRLLKEHSEMRVVNVSLSYNWAINGHLKIDPNFDKEAQQLDVEGWRAEDLPSLLESADLHLDLSELFERWGLDRANIVVLGATERVATAEAAELVITVPPLGFIDVRVQGMRGVHEFIEQCAQFVSLESGQDLWVELEDC